MTNRHRYLTTLAALVTATAIIACADAVGIPGANRDGADKTVSAGRPDSGRGRADTGKTRPDSNKPRPDTGKPRPDTGKPRPDTGKNRPDTGRGPVPDTTITDGYIHGDVVGVDSSRTPAIIAPLGNVAVTVYRQVRVAPVPGDTAWTIRWDSVRTMRTDTKGGFSFTDLRGGIYRVRAVPPTGSGYPSGEVLTVAWSRRSVVVLPIRIYLHKN